jgi:hypothetical protein
MVASRLVPDARACYPPAVADTPLLVIDDGPYWFELRGVSVRGIASRVDAPPGAAAVQLAWYTVGTGRVLAWDYGAVREE